MSFDDYSKEVPQWVTLFMASSWFIGLIVLFWVYQFTQITFLDTLKYLIFFSVFFTLLPYKWMVKIIPVDYLFMLLINLIGFGPLFTSIFLSLNFFITDPKSTQVSKIRNVDYGEGWNANQTVIELEQNALENCPKFRTFDSAYRMEILNSDSYHYTTAKGLFGFEVLTDYHFAEKIR